MIGQDSDGEESADSNGDVSEMRVEKLLAGANGESVNETKLTRVGSAVLKTGTLADAPLVAHLRPNEQPHHVFFSETKSFVFDGEEVLFSPQFWQAVVVTNQRLLVLVGDDAGDRGEVIPYEAVSDVYFDKVGTTTYEFAIDAGGVHCRFLVESRVDYDELRTAAQYVEAQAKGEDDRTPETERERGRMYEISNLEVDATIWRPGEDDADVDDEVSGDAETSGDADRDTVPERQTSDLPDGAVLRAVEDDLEVVLFEDRLWFDDGENDAEISLHYVLEADFESDDGEAEVEFEFGVAGDSMTFEVEDAELELEPEDHPRDFERLCGKLSAIQSGETETDEADELVQTLKETYARGEITTEDYKERLAVLTGEEPPEPEDSPVTPQDVMSDGMPDELEAQFEALAAIDPE
ncbi:PH domain-containing protein [Halorussus halophilus]|uniref:PH domain-containing protein n=1 Tax=Halorussus halophilus TaxID=2650975 RepID=UPI0013018D31|nr:PH domain-containing protein [Halorussus halophilus]